MAEEDKFRVEARLTGASRGISPTTEQIQVLRERRDAHDRLTRPAPKMLFDVVLQARQRGQNEGEGHQGGETDAEPQPPAPTFDRAVQPAQVPATGAPTRPVPTGAPPGGSHSPHLQAGGRSRKFIVRG